MAISRITASGVATDTLTAADIADDAIGTAELANDVVISTSGAITTTGAFTSVGIDDNASGAVAITIDSSENVGIGATTVDEILHLESTTTNKPVFKLEQSTNDATSAEIKFVNGQGGGYAGVAGHDLGRMTFTGNMSNGSPLKYAEIYSEIVDPHATTGKDGKIGFKINCLDTDTEIMTIKASGDNASGNVGIGTTTPSPFFECDVPTGHDTSTDYHFKFENTQSGTSVRCAGMFIKAGGNLNTVGAFNIQDHDGTNRFFVGGTGRVGIGKTSPDSLLQVYDAGNTANIMRVYDGASRRVVITAGNSYTLETYHGGGNFSNQTGDGYHWLFYKDGNNQGGYIHQSGGNTTYDTSSDYRLKENVVSLTGAITRLKELKPYRFNFIGEDRTQDGFFAHEAQVVVPQAVVGEKDGMIDRENVVSNADGTLARFSVLEEDWEEGKISGEYASDTTWLESKSCPEYQGMDHSMVVPLLVGALQEAITRIETLEAA